MAESKNLCLQNEARSETISETKKQSQHWRGKATRRCFANAMISIRTEFLVWTPDNDLLYSFRSLMTLTKTLEYVKEIEGNPCDGVPRRKARPRIQIAVRIKRSRGPRVRGRK